MPELDRYEQLCQYIKSLGNDIKEFEQKERISFVSDSKNKIRTVWKGLKLVQLEKNYNPYNFRVLVRIEKRGMMGTSYPYIIKTISDYSPTGGSKDYYPSFRICSDEDLEKAKKIIKFAYENL